MNRQFAKADDAVRRARRQLVKASSARDAMVIELAECSLCRAVKGKPCVTMTRVTSCHAERLIAARNPQ